MQASQIALDPTTYQAIVADAAMAWPREMVGMLARAEDGSAHYTPLPNIAITDDRFAVEPAAFARAVAELDAAGRSFLGFVHSHPNGTATPSAVDRLELWTGCVQLIVAITVTGVGSMRAWWFDGVGARELDLPGHEPTNPASCAR